MAPALHLSPEKKVEALRLRDEGYTKYEITKVTGMSMSTLSMLFRRAKELDVSGETTASPADLASVFPTSLFLKSAGWPRVKVNEYMVYQIYNAMEEEEEEEEEYYI